MPLPPIDFDYEDFPRADGRPERVVKLALTLAGGPLLLAIINAFTWGTYSHINAGRTPQNDGWQMYTLYGVFLLFFSVGVTLPVLAITFWILEAIFATS